MPAELTAAPMSAHEKAHRLGCFTLNAASSLSSTPHGADSLELVDSGTRPYMTPAVCLRHCAYFNFAYAAVHSGNSCRCSDTPPTASRLADPRCNSKCSGNETLSCGSANAMEMYSTQGSQVDTPPPLASIPVVAQNFMTAPPLPFFALQGQTCASVLGGSVAGVLAFTITACFLFFRYIYLPRIFKASTQAQDCSGGYPHRDQRRSFRPRRQSVLRSIISAQYRQRRALRNQIIRGDRDDIAVADAAAHHTYYPECNRSSRQDASVPADGVQGIRRWLSHRTRRRAGDDHDDRESICASVRSTSAGGFERPMSETERFVVNRQTVSRGIAAGHYPYRLPSIVGLRSSSNRRSSRISFGDPLYLRSHDWHDISGIGSIASDMHDALDYSMPLCVRNVTPSYCDSASEITQSTITRL
ncbi:hypothetical protein THASP1DRAFT_32204 [Thamnocephalis sphaerospora]|uniref:WSC domain-containing protein n=1 Tax=Thamnocephalis sphaerospora TaxID=78915 RepID=A0A4V1IW14_9FUNG|nr:hypothetical protein THASP1DRAFT_32204 [Thamnocephalis sphaerospora]|eukprot:RKP05969.1 hypothetical protein THASP1DRAFT_32204 [Thamnocephalis sphaerospora]